MDEDYIAYTYDADGNVRRRTEYSGKDTVIETVVNDYYISVDLKSVLVSNYWYQNEPMIGGYTRYKFFGDGTYQSLWIVDYADNNPVITGNYRVEGDKIILEGNNSFTTFYNERLNIMASGSYTPVELDPMYGGSGVYLNIIIATDKYFDEYSDEMMKYLDSIQYSKREKCITDKV